MKENIKVVAFCIAILLFIVGFYWGLISLLNWTTDRDMQEAKERCEQIAKLSNADDWKSIRYTCTIVKDNKLEEIK